MNALSLLAQLAVPSFVLSGTVKENVRFLNGRVGEVGLCFFESQACLAYTDADIPTAAECGILRFHVHLPLDLVWPDAADDAVKARQTAQMAFAILQKAGHLAPRCAVLHPPEGTPERQRSLLAAFADEWHKQTSVPLLLENTEHCSVASLGQSFLKDWQMGFCLDTGHLLTYKQDDILASDLPENADLLHWSAPGEKRPHRHLPLRELADDEMNLLQNMVNRLPQQCTQMLELFAWSDIVDSLPILCQLLGQPDAGGRL